MVEILDIFLTKRDKSLNSSYRDEIIIKTFDGFENKHYASTLVGFIKVEPYDMRGGYNEKLFDNIKEVSLINGIDKTLPIYLLNPLFNFDAIKTVIIDGESGRHAIGLNFTDGLNLTGAYSLNLDEGRMYHFHKQEKSIKREDLISSIVKDFERSLGQKVVIKRQKINKQENNNQAI